MGNTTNSAFSGMSRTVRCRENAFPHFADEWFKIPTRKFLAPRYGILPTLIDGSIPIFQFLSARRESMRLMSEWLRRRRG